MEMQTQEAETCPVPPLLPSCCLCVALPAIFLAPSMPQPDPPSDWQHQLGWPPRGDMPVSWRGQLVRPALWFLVPPKAQRGVCRALEAGCQASRAEQGRPSTQPSSCGGRSFATPRPKPETQPRLGRYSLTPWFEWPEWWTDGTKEKLPEHSQRYWAKCTSCTISFNPLTITLTSRSRKSSPFFK